MFAERVCASRAVQDDFRWEEDGDRTNRPLDPAVANLVFTPLHCCCSSVTVYIRRWLLQQSSSLCLSRYTNWWFSEESACLPESSLYECSSTSVHSIVSFTWLSFLLLHSRFLQSTLDIGNQRLKVFTLSRTFLLSRGSLSEGIWILHWKEPVFQGVYIFLKNSEWK